MSNRDLLSAYKEQLKDLTEEKQDLIKLADEKDARIKKLLIQLEQANADVENLGKRIAEVEAKAKKKDKIKIRENFLSVSIDLLQEFSNLA